MLGQHENFPKNFVFLFFKNFKNMLPTQIKIHQSNDLGNVTEDKRPSEQIEPNKELMSEIIRLD